MGKKAGNLNCASSYFQVTDGQWEAVKDSMVASNWTSESIVALIQWIPDLTKDTMPTILRETLLSGESATAAPSPVGSDSRALVELAETDPGALEKLVQWSDLIIFDYITGNYDRVASMQVRTKSCWSLKRNLKFNRYLQ
jgi:four-jointed box protein 1